MISPGFCFYTDNGERERKRERKREREKASQTIVPLVQPRKEKRWRSERKACVEYSFGHSALTILRRRAGYRIHSEYRNKKTSRPHLWNHPPQHQKSLLGFSFCYLFFPENIFSFYLKNLLPIVILLPL
ncbi:hypothetical protein JCM10003_602 [Bacteroides pyogenes JCM 10003]|nr:hypothetical protein JCM10003_602 [Bacteroides pyogenes JCM 10003]